MKRIAGLDVGTTGCKVTVFSAEGENLGREYRDYPVTRETDAQEIDAEALASGVRECLRAAKARFGRHTHYIYVDLDYPRYPVYERAAVDWFVLCSDRICLALVNGQPDLSMVVVPSALVEDLSREFELRCGDYYSEHRQLPRERDLWLNLICENPDWFSLREMSGPRELFSLTMIGRHEEWG